MPSSRALNLLILAFIAAGVFVAAEVYRIQTLLNNTTVTEFKEDLNHKRKVLLFPHLVSLLATYQSNQNLLNDQDVVFLERHVLSKGVVRALRNHYADVKNNERLAFWSEVLSRFPQTTK